jgi:hypothetical protein
LMRLLNGYINRRPLMDRDGSGVSALLGLDGFVVRAQLLEESSGEWWLAVETAEDRAWCPACGVRAIGHGRRRVVVRDLGLPPKPWRVADSCWSLAFARSLMPSDRSERIGGELRLVHAARSGSAGAAARSASTAS